ncbi:hypothetical protein CC99x_000350 [Candidatus Berkiella cookevillensis]|uniref:DnaJ domain protein n=1 Tax=Candidatus Berkiella cookevillensis TaxID=437022 RepID=A0A0Q9YJX8_9GAMM|nr:hypothetical protein [Candidatus Berkiella cookevillensis]MCS5707343.1 hypothetical protein [Candidatus Berkiella cookevillensis]
MLNEVSEFVKSFHFNNIFKSKINFSKILLVAFFGLGLHAGLSLFLSYALNTLYIHNIGMPLSHYLGLSSVFHKTQWLAHGLAAFVAFRVAYHVSLNRNIEMLRERAVQWLHTCYQHLKSQIIKLLDIRLSKDKSIEEPKPFFIKLRERIKNMLTSASNMFKRAVATVIPPRLFFRIAKVLPIGGWTEHVKFPEGVLDDFQYTVLCESAEEVKIILDTLPKEVLYRLLKKKNQLGHTPLYTAAINGEKEPWAKRGDKFRYILEAIEPEQRVQFLQESIGEGLSKDSLVGRLKLDSTKPPYWSIIQSVLSPEQLKALVYTVRDRGDSLLHSKAFTAGAREMLMVLEPLNEAERKAYLIQMCPHGRTPMIELFYRWKMENVEPVFAMLPQKDWQEVFAMQPEGWSMSIGEKIMAVCHSSDKEEYAEHIKYLSENYALDLPDRYKKLTEDDQEEALEDLHEALKSSKCDLKENFKKKYGDTPEGILDMEPLLEASAYVPAYRKLQLKYHPDRAGAVGTEMSAKLNAAKKFIEEREERQKYESASILDDPEIWNILTRKAK